MTKKSFSLDDAVLFGRLSGDTNPLHTDPVTARRLLFGTTVYHGMGLVLWAIEETAASITKPISLVRVKATFRRPVPAGEAVTIRTTRDDAESAEMSVESVRGVCATISLAWKPRAESDRDSLLPASGSIALRDLGFADAARMQGAIDLFLNEDILKLVARNAAYLLPHRQISLLLSMTRLVGMECPGNDSIFNSFNVDFQEAPGDETRLSYQIKSASEKYSRLGIKIESLDFRGEIQASMRPKPQIQPSQEAIRGLVKSDEFAGQQALIVGGSRGLGELVAKLIAAGGGTVNLTYCVGQRDAESLAEALENAGGSATAIQFDVEGDFSDAVAQIEGRPITHLYYFASPRILLDSTTEFDANRFARYCRFYVNGLVRLIHSLKRSDGQKLRVFYPSSAFLDEPVPGALEYVAAKAAGEAVLEFLIHEGDIMAVVRRLPPLATDQTASLLGVTGEVATSKMLDAVRAMNVL